MTGPYDRWRLPELYAMVANESDAAAVAHLQAWEQQHHLLVTQKQRLESLIAELENYWSPTRSEASLAFIDRLKQMVRTIDLASISAARIWGGLGHIADALNDTKRDLGELRAQYDDPTAAAKAFNKRALPQLPENLAPSQSVIPGLDKLMTREHQERLDEKARAIMVSADQRVAEATETMGTMPELGRIDEGLRLNPGEPTSTASQSGSPYRYVPTPTFEPPQPTSIGQPILAEGPSVASGPPTTPHIEPVQVPLNDGPNITSSFVVLPGSSRTPVESQAFRTGVLGEPPGQAAMRGTPAKTAASPSALPYPGVIGGGAPPPAGAQARHRGVRDGSAVLRPPRIREERSEGGGRSADGGWFDRSFAQYAERRQDRQQSDQGTMWDVEEGVPPILEAPHLPAAHDPGPGVIGIDR
ncbi:hypothetical protein ACFFX1_05115 [Dactylosporangium sucinum]|uniref:PPE family domain-containing protein n=1 Tax=Dactylosporangium sucinum TaxID=1424081 RepID=A0A917TQ03_9ACTN|nr:hypothetical protein [Dactylosporangium sucinum]GGM32642.1 hypothetical protein GCM10007977_037510 [Dactylosporangium sucinum]